MAKKRDEQIPLIDVDDPTLKKVKKEITEYEALKEENAEQGSANRVAEQTKRKKVLQAVQDANLKPDSDGVYHIQMAGTIYNISQEAQLRIKKQKAPATDNGGDGGDDEAPEVAGKIEPSTRSRER